MNFNAVVLGGRLTRDPETRSTNSGKTLANFGIAVGDRFRKETTHFFDCTAWGKTGEIICEHLSKGDPILVRGRLEQRSWEAKDGVKRSKIEVVVDEFSFVGGGGGQSRDAKAAAKAEASAEPEDRGAEDPFGELPF